MDKSELFEILQKLDSLVTFGELLPPEFKERYLNDINELKKKINDSKTETVFTIPEKPSDNTVKPPINISATSDDIQIPNKSTGTVPPPPPALRPPPPPPPHMKPPPPPLFTATGTFNVKKLLEQEKANTVKTETGSVKPVFRSSFESLSPELANNADKKLFSNILDFIIPVFNDKARAILNDPERKELAGRIDIIDGESSLLKIYDKNIITFKDKLAFIKFILKIDSQALLTYKENINVQEREIWVKYGELMVSLGLITESQLSMALSFRVTNEKLKNMFFGETLKDLDVIDAETLEESLRIHKWFNEILARISYENSFVDSIQSVLQDTLDCNFEIGSIKKISFSKPLADMICILFPISGKLNGNVYYILDRSFMSNLSKKLMSSYGLISSDLDSSIITEVSNMITGSSLTRLSEIGIQCETSVPQIITDAGFIIADNKPVSVIPLLSEMGRFAVGLEINE